MRKEFTTELFDIPLDIKRGLPVRNVLTFNRAFAAGRVAKEEGFAFHIVARPDQKYTVWPDGLGENEYTGIIHKGEVCVDIYNYSKDLGKFWEKVDELEKLSQFN